MLSRYHISCLAYDPVQKLLAIGSYDGNVKVLGGNGVEHLFETHGTTAVNQIAFIPNKNVIITVSSSGMFEAFDVLQVCCRRGQPLKLDFEYVIQHG